MSSWMRMCELIGPCTGIDDRVHGNLRDLVTRFAREVEPSAARGALLGLAVGDALGTTNEFRELSAPAFPALASGPLVDLVGGGPFRLAPAFLLKGRSPFQRQGADDHAAQRAAMEAGPPPLPLPVDDTLLEVLRAGLDPDPARRPTARDLSRVS